MTRTRHLLQSSLLVIIFFALGKVTGLVRTQLLGRQFGTGLAFDAFTAANQLPEVFVTLLAGGALAAAFIPVYSAQLEGRRAGEALRVANAIITLVMAVLGSLSALGAILAPWLVRVVLVPAFSPEQQALTASLMRIILLQTTLFGVSGVLSSILNAHQHFALPALAPMALDLGYFLGIFLLAPRWGIRGVAWGTVAGGVMHILVQVPALLRYRFRYRPLFGLRLSGVREIIRLMGPRIVTLGTVQIADLFIIRLTSALPAGSTSGYFYGYALQQLPETLLGTAIAIVVFPSMAELFNAGDREGMKRAAMSALRIIWTLTIPAAVGLVLLGEPAIVLLLQRGQFDASSTRLVYGVLIFFSLRVVSEATLEIVARLFYAQHDTRTPMLAALGWLGLNVALAFALVDRLGAGGLALASTVAFTAQAAALLYLNRRRLGSLDEWSLLLAAGRASLAAAGMGGVILSLRAVLGPGLLFLGAGGTAGILAYALFGFLLGGRELPDLYRLLRQRS